MRTRSEFVADQHWPVSFGHKNKQNSLDGLDCSRCEYFKFSASVT